MIITVHCGLRLVFVTPPPPAPQGGCLDLLGGLDGWSSDFNKANIKQCLTDIKVGSKRDFKHDFFTSPLRHQITNCYLANEN